MQNHQLVIHVNSFTKQIVSGYTCRKDHVPHRTLTVKEIGQYIIDNPKTKVTFMEV